MLASNRKICLRAHSPGTIIPQFPGQGKKAEKMGDALLMLPGPGIARPG